MPNRVLVLAVGSRAMRLAAMLEELQRYGGREGAVVLVTGNEFKVPVNEDGTLAIPRDVIEIKCHDEIGIAYNFKKGEPRPVFTGSRRSKGERKRNKANRWS